MLFNLVIKDFIIAKKYLVFMLVFAIVGPIFITSKLELNNGGFISFVVTALYSLYILFNTVSMSEDKYKGSALLCATPYTRSSLVKAKYLFICVLFICSVAVYTMVSYIVPELLGRLNITNIGLAFLIVTVFFGILIPVQFRFGFEKTKFIAFIVVFLTPFIFPPIVEWLESNPSLNVTFSLPQMLRGWLPFVLTLLIGLVSMNISIRIYSRKNL
ncbi:ABC-2 transporter permease [Cohnella sp. WQ 127256]|uniref:ABC-2 transporter permease n=1 Tax=Cohnella sp. WQ 127256 TaxID=2938790 RepID=UPI0021180FB7|nr:ABC-2 transporter permease [Cohnella sp. WQ 127256]